MNRAMLANWVVAVQVLKEPGKTPASESYMWVYRSGGQEEKQIGLFDYQLGRSGDYARKFFESYKGFFGTDGYAGYNKVAGGIRCGCWAHVCRKFLEAIPDGDPNSE